MELGVKVIDNILSVKVTGRLRMISVFPGGTRRPRLGTELEFTIGNRNEYVGAPVASLTQTAVAVFLGARRQAGTRRSRLATRYTVQPPKNERCPGW